MAFKTTTVSIATFGIKPFSVTTLDAECYHSYFHVCWVLLRWMSLCWVSLCRVWWRQF